MYTVTLLGARSPSLGVIWKTCLAFDIYLHSYVSKTQAYASVWYLTHIAVHILFVYMFYGTSNMRKTYTHTQLFRSHDESKWTARLLRAISQRSCLGRLQCHHNTRHIRQQNALPTSPIICGVYTYSIITQCDYDTCIPDVYMCAYAHANAHQATAIANQQPAGMGKYRRLYP